MSSAKKSNTSKTAHVMNLLSRSRGGTSISTQTLSEAPAASQVPPPQMPVPTPPIIASMQSDLAVASKIKDALEASLMQEEALENHEGLFENEPALTPPEASSEDELPSSSSTQLEETAEAVAETEPSDQPDVEPSIKLTSPEEMPPQPVEISREDVPLDPVIPAETVPLSGVEREPVGASQDEDPEIQTHASENSYSSTDEPSNAVRPANTGDMAVIVNIMELLVEEMAAKYISLFGLCPCEQCRKDVIALALNHLPPKYVVMPKNNIRPRLAMYESRFNATITAQILHACKEVLENPRHDQAK